MSASSPWNVTVAPASDLPCSRKPTLQEIMDEEFARQLYENECRSIEELAADDTPDYVFAGFEDTNSDRELLSADSFFSSDTDDDEETCASIRTTSAIASTKPKGGFDRSIPVEGTEKGLNSIRESFRRQEKFERHGGRVESAKFATQDAVLDERTTLMLQKMINRGDLDEVHGCMQSGKEANVYFAIGTDPETFRKREYAVKIFKTTLNAFANRKDYITGDRRYDLAFQKKDRRRQIQEWSEKEFRNLSRAVKCIRAPEPVLFKEHIVVMSFIGNAAEGLPAPTLKEIAASLTPRQLLHAYADLLVATRTLFHVAKLVHGDLSEYNVLYQKQKCWLIDFGQAMDQTHPEFLDFLRRDLVNLRRFFQKQGVPAATAEEEGLLTVEEAFAWVLQSEDDVVADQYPLLAELLESKIAS